MKTMLANLNAIVGDTLTDSIQMIAVEELHESKDNFFVVDRIEEFAETILGQGGVKDNLVVRPLESGGYEIISGHRRKAAVQYLLDNGENISRYLPCLVQNYSDDDTRMLDLILMNISSRQISDTELWQSYEILNQILQNKKKSGEKFGRVRDKLAELLGVSSSQVRKLENVKKNAVPEVVEAVKSGELSISTADEIARMDDLEQEELMQQDLSSIRHKDIKKRNDEKAVIYDTNSEPDEKAVIYDTNSESEKSDTSSTNSVTVALSQFIREHYSELKTVLTTYTSTTDSDDEIQMIQEFQELLRRVKEF